MPSICIRNILTATILLATCHCDYLTPFRREEAYHNRYVNRSPFDDANAASNLETPFIWGSVRRLAWRHDTAMVYLLSYG